MRCPGGEPCGISSSEIKAGMVCFACENVPASNPLANQHGSLVGVRDFLARVRDGVFRFGGAKKYSAHHRR
jgi:hypothetical protein